MSKKPQESIKQPEQPLYTINIKFQRTNATYKPQEIVSGSISFTKRMMTKFNVEVQNIKMTVSGKVRIQNRQNNKIIEDMIKTAPKITIIEQNIEICSKKTITQQTNLPFKFKLQKQAGSDKYLQSYIGVYLAVAYDITFEAKFNDFKAQKIKQESPFYVQVANSGRQIIQNFQYPKPKYFMIRSQDIRSEHIKGHKFKIRGQLQSQIIYFSDYLLGKFIIDYSQAAIRSIDLQMLRNEKIQFDDKKFNQITEIQLIQVCDGDVTRNMQLPIYMILPRYFSCPSIQYKWLTLTFQINLVIGFKDGFKVTANIPLKLIRS